MQRVKRSTAVGALPAAPGGGTPGYFALPNPGGGVAATVPGYEWFNSIQEELCAIIAAGGGTLDIANLGQCIAAIKALYGNGRIGHAYTANDWMPLGGGFIVQWGSCGVTNGTRVLFPTAFPVACFVCVVGDISAVSGDSTYSQAAGIPDQSGFTFRSSYGAADASNYIAFGR